MGKSCEVNLQFCGAPVTVWRHTAGNMWDSLSIPWGKAGIPSFHLVYLRQLTASSYITFTTAEDYITGSCSSADEILRLQYNLLSCAHAYCSWSNSILSWPNLTDYICSVVGTDLPSSHIIVTLHPAELKEGTRNVDPHLLDNSQQRVLLLHRTPQWAFAVRLHLFFIVWAQETDYRVSQEYYLLN